MYSPIEPFASGMLAVSDGNALYWEKSGNRAGRPALYVHGGPGIGLRTGYRRWFDPAQYLVIGFDQRGCGRSRPWVIEDLSSLSTNTTQRLVADMEVLRSHLGVARWLLAGVSWGTTLSLAYAQTHPDRVDGMVLLASTLGDAAAVQWITETVGRLFPAEWEEFRAAAHAQPGQRLIDAYYERLIDPDPAVRETAAQAWDRWENARVLGPRQQSPPWSADPVRRIVAATLVVHYMRHGCFLPNDALLRDMPSISQIPGTLVQGRLDVSGAAAAWQLHKHWPASKFVMIDDEGHGGRKMIEAAIEATNRALTRPRPRG